MGGGSGINITIRINGMNVKFNGSKLTAKPKDVTIAEFSAIGYSDGLSYIKPHMLKVTGIEIEMDDLDIEWMKNGGYTRGDEVYLEGVTFENLIFPGFVRGKWQSEFPMTLEADGYVAGIGSVTVYLTVTPSRKRPFNQMWHDIFDIDHDYDDLHKMWGMK